MPSLSIFSEFYSAFLSTYFSKYILQFFQEKTTYSFDCYCIKHTDQFEENSEISQSHVILF